MVYACKPQHNNKKNKLTERQLFNSAPVAVIDNRVNIVDAML